MVGLGFGMNLHESLQTGKEGMVFTVISVAAVLLLGCCVVYISAYRTSFGNDAGTVWYVGCYCYT